MGSNHCSWAGGVAGSGMIPVLTFFSSRSFATRPPSAAS